MSPARALCPDPSGRNLSWLLVLLMVLLTGCHKKEGALAPADLKEGELMVTTTVPPSAEVKLVQTLGFDFAGAQVPGQEDADSGQALAPARIQPAISGSWHWSEPDQLVFRPSAAYQANTSYRVELEPEYFHRLGLKLRGPAVFQFEAQPFACRNLYLSRTRTPEYPAHHLVQGVALFNYPVDPEALARALDCRLDDGRKVACEINSVAVDKRLEFQIEALESGDQDRTLTVSLAQGLKPVKGDHGLAQPRAEEIVIPARETLQINSLDTTSDAESPVVEIDFSEEVLPEDLQKHLKIDPPMEDLKIVGRWGSLKLKGSWQFHHPYQVTVDAGLTSRNGVPLQRKFTRTVTIDDLEPLVRIAGPGNYLSLRGDGQVAVETINLDRFDVRLDRVFANNLVPFLQKVGLGNQQNYYYDWSLDEQGTTLYSRSLSVASRPRNKIAVTPVNLKTALQDDPRGIFRLRVGAPGSGRRGDGRWIVATDLGLVAKQSQGRVEVAVASISQLTPLAGVRVKVLSYNNQELASAVTDPEGLVSFKGLSGTQAGARPYVVVATKGRDLSFLAFDETRVRTADLDVGGVDPGRGGYRAYLYGDRDIYRPGETAHLVWVVRDGHLQPPSGFPLNLKIRGPEGQDFLGAKVACDEAGTGEFNLDLPAWAMTGRYTALLFLGQEELLGEADFSVEDFIPDRMKARAQMLVQGKPPRVVGPGDQVNLESRAMTLFGPPAADRSAEAALWFQQTRVRIPGFEEFTFGDHPGRELPPRRDLGRTVTDDEGYARWSVPLPQVADYQGWLRMTALVKVTEKGGGRAVSTSTDVVFSPTDELLGLRNLSRQASDYVQAGQQIEFEGVLVDLAGQPLATENAHLKVMRKQWRTVLKQDGTGKFRYVSQADEKLVEERTVSLAAGPTHLTVTPATYGSYRLVLEKADGSVRGALDFYVYGFGYSPWAMNNPEKVNLKLDRATYGDGDVVTASVEAPFPGLMLLTLERDRVFSRRWFRLNENTATIQMSLPQGSAPNVYLTATVLRSLDDLDPRAPARAFGAVPVFIDREPATLPVQVSVPEKIRPLTRLKLKVKLPPTTDPLRLTVAAVDEGILQLTDFQLPSALDFFLQRRRLGVESYDIWSLLLPKYERASRKSATGGGESADLVTTPAMAKRLNPLAASRVQPVALWSGLLTGQPGWHEVSFDVPEFDGTLRVMVVAVAKDRFGSAEARVRVADPLVLSPSLPRFLAPGDRFRVPVPVFNGLPESAGDHQNITVGLAVAGALTPGQDQALVVDLPVSRGQESVAWFDLQASGEVGKGSIRCTAQAAGESVSRLMELAVRPAQALESRVISGTVDQTHPFLQKISDQWLAGSSVTTLTVAPNPLGRFGAALPYLLRYPYGCVEQITSRSFPLLFFGELAASLAPGEFGDHDGDYFVNGGLDHVAALFRQGVGFAMWPGRGGAEVNPWATTYVTHFLVEARTQGFVLPEGLLEGALQVVAEYARSTDSGWPASWSRLDRLRTRCYACFVLASADRPDRGAMDQLTHDEWKMLSPAGRTLLAGAYALTGNQDRFAELLPALDAPEKKGRSFGYTWRSPARDDALRLTVLATVAPDHPQVPRLFQRLARQAHDGRWSNTQENAFALLAMGKLATTGKLNPASGRVLVQGQVVAQFDTAGVAIQGHDWAGKTVEIEASTPGSAWFTLLDEGVPLAPSHEQLDAGLVVRREYFDMAGQPVSPTALVQGQTIVCRLLLSSDKGPVKDVVISDLLPAGLEIENPRLDNKGPLTWISRAQDQQFGRLPREHLEVRDDRLLLFTSADSRVAAFYYTLRAVTVGRFAWPQVRAEAMYDPDVMSVRGGGEIQVVAP